MANMERMKESRVANLKVVVGFNVGAMQCDAMRRKSPLFTSPAARLNKAEQGWARLHKAGSCPSSA
jgi:hypothetical protein